MCIAAKFIQRCELARAVACSAGTGGGGMFSDTFERIASADSQCGLFRIVLLAWVIDEMTVWRAARRVEGLTVACEAVGGLLGGGGRGGACAVPRAVVSSLESATAATEHTTRADRSPIPPFQPQLDSLL